MNIVLNMTKLRSNFKFLFIAITIIVVTVILSVLSGNEVKRLENKPLENGEVAIGKLVINELMTSNGGVYSDPKGNLPDWIELYNGSNQDINLDGYGLTDETNTIKWAFSNVTIKSKSYLVINLSGKNEEGLYAGFKLKSEGGETVALTKPNGKVVDAIETTRINKNEAMARDLDGNWFTSSEPTPGYANTKEGLVAYQESLYNLESDIKINEVLAKNNGNFMDSNGDFTGYIELINIGNKTVNLKNYSVSNNILVPFKWQIPDVDLGPKQVLVIYSKSKVTEYALPFSFENKEGTAVLTNNQGQIIDKVAYENLENGMALKRIENEFFKTNVVSPGEANTESGEQKFARNNIKNKSDLIINEVMNSNFSYLVQNGTSYYDWVEIKNNSGSDINLKEYYLSTNENIKDMYNLPNITLKKGDILVLMASGDINLSNNSYKHTNFKLSETESLYLYKNDSVVDSMFIANIPVGYSMGRNKTNGFYYFSNPTPLKENQDGKIEVSIAPSFQTDSGVYNDIDNIALELKTSGPTYYTLDGSTPTTSSTLYKGPISLKKTTVVKAITLESEKIKSDVTVGTYVINEKHTLPVLSVSTDQKKISNLNSNAWVVGTEVDAYAELYEEDGHFSIPCGLTLFGGSARSQAKKSYTLRFRKKYGEASLNYQVFDNRDFSNFETLVIRSGSQDYKRSLIRDELMTSLMEDGTDVDVQAYKAVILYINGNYWGIYYIREKVEAEYVANHYSVDENKANIMRIDGDVTAGSSKDYRDLMTYITNNSLSVQKNYEYVKTKINIENLCDFWAAETYVANNDIINTRFFSHPDIDNGRWHFIFYDLDFGMYNVSHNYYNFTVNPGGMSDFNVSTFLLRNLMKNKEFQKTYASRISYNLKNTWSEEKVLTRIDELYNLLLPEIERDNNRWNLSVNEWKEWVEKLRSYAKNRTKYMVRYAKAFFNLSDSEMKEYFGEWL